MSVKTCKACNFEKPETEFYRTKSGGYRGKCKACFSLHVKKTAVKRVRVNKAPDFDFLVGMPPESEMLFYSTPFFDSGVADESD